MARLASAVSVSNLAVSVPRKLVMPYLAVFGLLVVTTQKVGNRPDEGRKRLLIHWLRPDLGTRAFWRVSGFRTICQWL
jgi:hypothetical protein